MKKTFAFLLMLVLALGISVHAATLPAGFEELDYVSAAGNSYFDTELYATAATKIEAKFSYDKDGCYLYGASDNPSTVNTLSSLLKSEANGNWRLMNGSVGLKFAHDTVYETVHDASGVTVNGTLNAFSATPSATQKTPWTYVIGSCVNASGSPNSSAWKFSGDIYYIKISENGTLIRSFVPALRTSDSVAGLYDTVEGKFYVSEGTSDFFAPNAAPALVIDANAGIVRNAVTGEIYFAKKADLEHAMASTTKIMTALLSVEHLDLESRTLPAIASDQVGSGNTRIDLEIGEELKVKDALHGLMLPSGNDAANLLGRTVAGSYEAFSEMMNAKAAELGLKQTCFTTPSGTDAPGHYTTAADYSVVANEAMSYEAFRKIVSTTHYTIEAEPEYKVVERELKNTNYLLPGLDLDGKVYSYDGAVGIKTGTTGDAGSCLVSAATRNGTDLIAVVLGAPGNTNATNRFTESIKLLDCGFETAAAQPYTVTADGNKLTAVNPETGYTMVATINAPDAAFAGESVEPAIVTTTYPEGITWNTYWDVTYTNNDKVGTATASITFGGKTATCEFEIVEPTVTLTEDTVLESLVVSAGQTYDLGGHTLSVKNGLVVNEGGKIMGGTLAVSKGMVASLGSNGGCIPVWTGSDDALDYYALFSAEIKPGKNVVSTDAGTTYSFGYKMTEANGANPYNSTVAAGEKIKLGVQLSLDGAKATYNFSADSIAKMEGINAAASSGDFFKVNLKLAGGNNDLSKVRVAPVIKVKDLGFEYVGETTGEGSGEYVARINTTGYYTLEDAIAAVTELGAVTDVKLMGDIEYKRPTTVKLNGLTRFITLARSNIEISGPVTFDGEGVDAKTTLFRVYGSSTLTLKDGVTVQNYVNTNADDPETNHSYGAVARVESTLKMDGVSIRNCTGPIRGAFYLCSTSTTEIRNCSFEGNSAAKQFGGAIALYAGKSLVVANCTFTDNSCGTYGGAIGLYGGEAVTLTNNTFTDNSCGASYRGGAVGVNSGFTGDITVDGATFSGNTVGDLGTGGGSLTLTGKVEGLDEVVFYKDTHIVLGDTFEMAEDASLTAKGSYATTGVTGAEMNSANYLNEYGVHQELAANVANVGVAQYTSLAAAIKATENVTSATVIELYGDDTITEATTVTLNPNVQIKVTANVTVSGPLTIDGANKAHTSALPFLVDGCKLTLEGVTLQNIVNEYVQNYCGMIRVQNSGELVFDGVTVKDCVGTYGLIGGQSNTKSFTLKNSTFTNNRSAMSSGGVIFAYGSPVVLENCVFSGNSSAQSGGVFHSGLSGSTLTATNCTFTNNTAARNAEKYGGGAISGYAVKSITLDGCTFSGNTADGVSQDVWYRGGTLYLKGETSIETIRMEASKAIALNDEASFAKTVTLSGAGAASGSGVLMGTKVAEYHSFFAPADTTLKVDSTGKIVSK